MKEYLVLRLGAIHINLLFIPTIIFALFFGYLDLFLISFLSVLLHECAHIICAGFLNVGISYIEIQPFGVCAVLRDGYINNSEKEFCIAFVGPFSSLMIATLVLFLKLPDWEYIFNINICISAINLLPALPLDGGRMIKSMLTYKMGILRAYNISRKFSKSLVFVMLPISCLILFLTKFNFSYILITAFLLGNMYTEQKSITFITLREILDNPTKTSGIKRTKTYTVSCDQNARKILRYISYDYYIAVNITKGGEIITTLTEEQILTALVNRGISISFGDILYNSDAYFAGV